MAVSTLAEAKTQYLENLDYDTESSVARCKLFITACRALLLHVPARVQHGGSGADGVEFNQEELRLELANARDWLSSNDPTAADSAGGGGVVHADFTDYRREN